MALSAQLEEPLLHDAQTAVNLIFGDHQRHQSADDVAEVSARKEEQAVLVTVLDQGLGFVVGWFLGDAIPNQFETLHGADAPNFSDDLIFFLPGFKPGSQLLPKGVCCVKEVLFLEDV
jgi:hypothetical protein